MWAPEEVLMSQPGVGKVGPRTGLRPDHPIGGQLCFVLSLVCLAGCEGPPRTITRGSDAPTQIEPSEVRVAGTAEVLATVRDVALLQDGGILILIAYAHSIQKIVELSP